MRFPPACALLLVLALLAPVARPEPADPVRAAQARGLAFLLGSQNADGSWGSFESRRTGEIYLGTTASHSGFQVAVSALCTAALIQPARTDPAARRVLERGAAFLLQAPPTARATGSTFYNNWTHVYLIQCLARLLCEPGHAGRDPASIRAILQREIADLGSLQGMEGGFGYYDFGWALPQPTGHESTSFLTAAALAALHEAAGAGVPAPHDMVERALQSLERLRLPDGAYIYGTYAQMAPERLYNRVKGSLGRSQAGNYALWLYRRPGIGIAELVRGLADLKENHHFIAIGRGRPYPHEAWYYTAGYYFFFGHYYAARIVREMDEASRSLYRPWLCEVLAGLQDPDGSWWDFPFYGYHQAYGTAFALLALQALE